MVKVKPGVQFSQVSFIQPEIMRIIWIAQLTAPDGHEVTITCGVEDHAPHTSHAQGKAFDFRTRDIPSQSIIKRWARRIQDKLGSCYFVLVEPNEEKPNAPQHIHVQYNG